MRVLNSYKKIKQQLTEPALQEKFPCKIVHLVCPILTVKHIFENQTRPPIYTIRQLGSIFHVRIRIAFPKYSNALEAFIYMT